MKNILLLFLFVVVLQFSACKPALYKHFIDIPNNVWQKDNTVVFKVDMDKPVATADVRLAIRYVDGYLYDHLKVNVKRISPSNKKSEQELNIKMMDGNEGYIGEGMGDLWDLEQVLTDGFENFEESGTYQYEVSQTMKDDQFPLVVEVGLIVEEKTE
ncbi:MAG: gliding motility lipoprotein GldH [Chitinophagales bacterium]